MAGEKKRVWNFSELENLPQGEIYDILDEIPSGSESEESDMESVMGEEVYVDPKNLPEGDLFDIQNMDIIFEEENDHALQVGADNGDMDWDSEDDVPLARLVTNQSVIWTNNENYVTKTNPFLEPTGANLPENVETPTDVFLSLFPEDLIQDIVFQTNLYYLQKHGGGANFTPTSEEEIKIFLGVNLLMGIKQMPSYRDYWSSRDELRDNFISAIISRDRFSWLLSYIHLNDNSVQPGRNDPNFDKLYKVRPLLSKVRETFLCALNPHEFQSIDESMIRFKGRSSIRQYMPNKPIKRGYKVWVRADSTGFMCDFQIYTGKISQTTEKNLGLRVVKDLSRALVGKHHKVFFDNYFNSIELQRSLLSDGIYACGTIRKGRKYFPELKSDKDMIRGDKDYRISTCGLVGMKWMDRRSVLFLGNYQNPAAMGRVPRRKKDGVLDEITCPQMIIQYNAHMGYVDKFDMLKSLYEVDRKSHKWWHRIFFYFVDACVVNAFILFQLRSESQGLNLKAFRLSVARGLIGAVVPSKRGRPSNERPVNKFKKVVPLELRYSKACHMPQRSTLLRCANCSTTKEVRRTKWKCSTCNVGLCIKHDKNCFAAYHTN